MAVQSVLLSAGTEYPLILLYLGLLFRSLLKDKGRPRASRPHPN